MPWKERTMEQRREEFVKQVLGKEKNKSALCREYGISRPTGDKWLKRYRNGESLSDQSRAPFHTANKTAPSVEKTILNYRAGHPAIGAVKIRRILENQGEQALPSASTVNAILKRNGCITREASLAAKPYERYEKAAPNEMWQADFKGHFTMQDGRRCHPLNVLDDCSRFNLCSNAQLTETLEETRPAFERLFEAFGMPFSLLCDNGNPWGTAQSTGFSRFEVWLMELGVLTLHCRIKHPQTQGKEERFNQSMKRELLRDRSFLDLADAQRQFDEYRDFYNIQRPHHALKLDTPSQHYVSSKYPFPRKIDSWNYPQGYELRKIKDTGFLTYGGQGYFLSEAFADKTIAIRESHISGCISLFFRQFRIGRIDTDKRVFTLKKAYLIEGDPRNEAKD